jgi:hypothetical protein
VTLSINDTQHKQQLSITMLCLYAECCVLFNVMLNVIALSVVMLNVIMLSVVMLSVIMLSVTVPLQILDI